MRRFRMSGRLIDAIELSPLTLDQMGSIAGIHPSDVSHYKSGRHFGKRTRLGLQRLAGALGVDPASAVVEGGR